MCDVRLGLPAWDRYSKRFLSSIVRETIALDCGSWSSEASFVGVAFYACTAWNQAPSQGVSQEYNMEYSHPPDLQSSARLRRRRRVVHPTQTQDTNHNTPRHTRITKNQRSRGLPCPFSSYATHTRGATDKHMISPTIARAYT